MVRDTSRAWTHRSRLLPKAAWLAIFLGLIGYWVSDGGFSVSQTSSVVRGGSFSDPHWWSDASLHPSGSDEDDVYVSTLDLRDAIDGDKDALVRVVEKVNEAHEQNFDIVGNNFLRAVERVQFAWHEPAGSLSGMRIYLFGGPLLWTNKQVMLHDIRDHDSVGRDSYREVWESEGWSFGPSFGHAEVTHDGAIARSWRVNVLGVFQIVSVCLVGSWLVGLIIRLKRVSKVKRRRVQFGVFFLLLVSVCVFILFDAEGLEHESGGGREVALSGAYTLGYLEQVVDDQDKLVAFCEDLLDLVPGEQEGDLLLAQAWEYNMEEDPSDIQWEDVSQAEVVLSAGYFAWFEYSRYEFERVEDAQEINVLERGARWRRLVRWGNLKFSWGPLEKQSSVSLTFFAWLSIGVMLWLLWAIVHWMALFKFRRVLKGRVSRNQCIYCAYPLSDEGKKARSLGIGS